MMRNVTVQLPEKRDDQLVVCASLTQAAATIYVAGLGDMSEEDAINKALFIYTGLVDRLDEASHR